MSSGRRHARIAILFAMMSLPLANCTSSSLSLPDFFGGQQQPAPPPAPAIVSAPPASIPARDIVGRWGYASYHNEADRTRTIAAARNACNPPFVISMGPNGGVTMLVADQTEPQELRLKGGPNGRNYIGPDGPAGDRNDREIVSFDGRVLTLKWLDPEIAGRYGIAVYVRCGARA